MYIKQIRGMHFPLQIYYGKVIFICILCTRRACDDYVCQWFTVVSLSLCDDAATHRCVIERGSAVVNLFILWLPYAVAGRTKAFLWSPPPPPLKPHDQVNFLPHCVLLTVLRDGAAAATDGDCATCAVAGTENLILQHLLHFFMASTMRACACCVRFSTSCWIWMLHVLICQSNKKQKYYTRCERK